MKLGYERSFERKSRTRKPLTKLSTNGNDIRNSSLWKAPFQRAWDKFQKRPFEYCLIPFIAAFVGWFTNWVAVQMMFYPINFVGIPIYRVPEVPLGFFRMARHCTLQNS